jgi:tetratricopeptide (TPR) repeat protein
MMQTDYRECCGLGQCCEPVPVPFRAVRIAELINNQVLPTAVFTASGVGLPRCQSVTCLACFQGPRRAAARPSSSGRVRLARSVFGSPSTTPDPPTHNAIRGRPENRDTNTCITAQPSGLCLTAEGTRSCVRVVVCVIVGGTDGLGKWSALNESLPGRIFISYRRQETAWPAGRLYDVLVEHFAAEQVFKDVDNIEPGEDFVERITAAVGSCDVLLVLIGPQWLTITDENGQPRLENPEDYVRLEIEAALKRKIRVIPILVDDAPMPRANQLPASLAALVRRNAVEINPLTFDTKRLMTTVHKTLAELKVPDTGSGSESPTATPRPDRSNQQVAEPEVDQLYDRALAAFWTERWDEAVDLLGQVLSRQPDYPDAARKLELARRQQQLASHYAQASAATDTGDWEQAVAEYTMIADTDPGYRDTNSQLANARHQQQLASLQAEARRLHRAGQWAAVINVGEQLQAIDPAVADPDGLMASARAQLAAEQQAARLAADYRTGLRLIDAGQWTEAVAALERVTRLDSTYQDAPALLDRARLELGQATALATGQDRQRATEQARREAKAKEQIHREAEEPARQEAEEQPHLSRVITRTNSIVRTIIGILVVVIFVIVILQLT